MKKRRIERARRRILRLAGEYLDFLKKSTSTRAEKWVKFREIMRLWNKEQRRLCGFGLPMGEVSEGLRPLGECLVAYCMGLGVFDRKPRGNVRGS